MIKFALLLLIGLSVPSVATAEVRVAGRHLIIFTAQPDELFGSYLLGIENTSKESAKDSLKIMIPLETVDFRAVEGVDADHLKLSEKGSLTMEREFKAGMNFTGLDFLVSAQFGRASMTFVPPYPIEELSLLVHQRSKLKISGSNIKLVGTMDLQQGKFDRYLLENIQPGVHLQLAVAGIPVSRTLFWWIGGGFAAILLIAVGIFTKRTWPTNMGRGEV